MNSLELTFHTTSGDDTTSSTLVKMKFESLINPKFDPFPNMEDDDPFKNIHFYFGAKESHIFNGNFYSNEIEYYDKPGLEAIHWLIYQKTGNFYSLGVLDRLLKQPNCAITRVTSSKSQGISTCKQQIPNPYTNYETPESIDQLLLLLMSYHDPLYNRTWIDHTQLVMFINFDSEIQLYPYRSAVPLDTKYILVYDDLRKRSAIVPV